VYKRQEVVVKDGNVVKEVFGDTIYVDVQVGEDLMNEVLKDVGEKFRRYYSVNLENYPVSDEYANSWRVIKIDATDIN